MREKRKTYAESLWGGLFEVLGTRNELIVVKSVKTGTVSTMLPSSLRFLRATRSTTPRAERS